MSEAPRKPELLAPAGGMPQLEAAIHGGADAVYFGLERGFNARARSTGFTGEQLADTMDRLHERGCRGYLTLNTLVFDEELGELEEQVRHAARCGVDALIVQDIGVARLARATAPNLPLHASTQMSITDADGVQFARSLGFKRVVIGRELSIDEIAGVTGEPEIEIEVFVHGALCVSYSGQCFSSEAWGGRSANRGQCAQTCRLPYGLLVDGELRQQGDHNYLLSPQDLMALPLVPRLVAAGIACFKIEGRLKGPEYVLGTVSAYRQAIDAACDTPAGAPEQGVYPVDKATRQHLAQVFSRGQDAQHDGLSSGFLEGPRHQELVVGRSPRHRGLYLGQVEKITAEGVLLELQGPVRAGDGVVFDSGKPQQKEPGGNVFLLRRDGKPVKETLDAGRVELSFGRRFHAEAIHVGDYVWRTKDASMDGGPRLQAVESRQYPVDIQVELRPGEPLRIGMRDRQGRGASAQTGKHAQAATGPGLDAKTIGKAIGQLGDTPLAIDSLEIDLRPGLFLPVGEIKQARREVVERFRLSLKQHQRDRGMPAQPVLDALLPVAAPRQSVQSPRLSLLCRSAVQVEAALAVEGVDEIIVDSSKSTVSSRPARRYRPLAVAAPRIFKPGEHRLIRYLLGLSPDALLVRSPGLLWHLHQLGGTGARYQSELPIPALWGDFSLNAANRLGAAALLKLGLARLTPTHDVNAAQLAALALGLTEQQRARIELIAHHHLPVFHTEHCVFARFLSQGNSYRDCGRPCEKHTVHLRDPGGADHLLLADVGCRNTVFNAQAQSAAPHAGILLDAGIAHWRIELVDEPAESVADVVGGYRALLNGSIDHRQLWKKLQQVPDANHRPQGVSLGSLSIKAEQSKSQMKKPTAR